MEADDAEKVLSVGEFQDFLTLLNRTKSSGRDSMGKRTSTPSSAVATVATAPRRHHQQPSPKKHRAPVVIDIPAQGRESATIDSVALGSRGRDDVVGGSLSLLRNGNSSLNSNSDKENQSASSFSSSLVEEEDDEEEDADMIDVETVEPHLDSISASSVAVTNSSQLDDDLYGDLDTSIFHASRTPRKETRDASFTTVAAFKEIEGLKAENKRLKKENRSYSANISSLHKTAKGEIEKKNFVIQQLQSRLQATVTDPKNRKSKAYIEEILKECKAALDESHSQLTLDKLMEITQQHKTDSDKTKGDSNKKQYVFGNMSLYLCREQIDFGRGGNETVVMEETQRSAVDISGSQGLNDSAASAGKSVNLNKSTLEESKAIASKKNDASKTKSKSSCQIGDTSTEEVVSVNSCKTRKQSSSCRSTQESSRRSPRRRKTEPVPGSNSTSRPDTHAEKDKKRPLEREKRSESRGGKPGGKVEKDLPMEVRDKERSRDRDRDYAHSKDRKGSSSSSRSKRPLDSSSSRSERNGASGSSKRHRGETR